MSLSINYLAVNKPTQTYQVKRQGQLASQNLPVNYSTQLASEISFAQRAAIMPAISFGSLKSRILENKLNELMQKYSQGEKPLILNIKNGFIAQIAKKITTKNKPLIVGITGQSASGKSTLIDKIEETLNSQQPKNQPVFNIIRGDDYYKDTSELRKKLGGFGGIINSGYSFDFPDSANLKTLIKDLKKLSNGHEVTGPKYDFLTSKSTPNAQIIKPAKVMLLDSIFALQPEVKDSLDVGIYVDCSADVIKKRWFDRAASRGLVGDDATKLFNDTTQKAQDYVIPSSKAANITLNGEASLDKTKEFVQDLYKLLNN